MDVQHAVLRVTVAAGPDSGVEAHGPRRLSILEDVIRLDLLELDLDEARPNRGTTNGFRRQLHFGYGRAWRRRRSGCGPGFAPRPNLADTVDGVSAAVRHDIK